jgi:predicted porin
VGVGTNLIQRANGGTGSATAVRSSNSVGYFLPPNLGGFYGQLMYAFGEKDTISPGTSNKTDRYVGGRFGYANGPVNVAAAYGESQYSNSAKLKNANIAGSYDFGVVKLMAEYAEIKDSAFDGKLKGWHLGVTAPVGAGLIKASYGNVKLAIAGDNNPKADQWALGYVHNLSKRTALYATIARISNKHGSGLVVGGVLPTTAAAPVGDAVGIPRTSTGYDFGLRHSF